MDNNLKNKYRLLFLFYGRNYFMVFITKQKTGRKTTCATVFYFWYYFSRLLSNKIL